MYDRSPLVALQIRNLKLRHFFNLKVEYGIVISAAENFHHPAYIISKKEHLMIDWAPSGYCQTILGEKFPSAKLKAKQKF